MPRSSPVEILTGAAGAVVGGVVVGGAPGSVDGGVVDGAVGSAAAAGNSSTTFSFAERRHDEHHDGDGRDRAQQRGVPATRS